VRRLSNLILVFGFAFAVLIILPALINKPFSPYPYLKVSDVIDLFTPLVLIPLYYLLLFYGGSEEPGVRSMVLFMVLAAVWVLGQGMHLAANSIGHWLADSMGKDINQVTYFYDELLSHFIWHLGAAALSAQLIFHELSKPLQGQIKTIWQEVVAGIPYGFTIAAMGLEGNTVALMFPFSALAAILCLIFGRGDFRQQKLLTFFLVGYGLAAIGFTIWGIIFRGFPPPTEVGIF
jgi:hypothetical protein